MTQQIVINVCHGGFGLSAQAEDRYRELAGKPPSAYRYEVARNDPVLVQVVSELGEQANGKYAKLKIVEVPRYVKWHIQEYDGREWVAEDHRTWS